MSLSTTRQIDDIRKLASSQLDQSRRSELGQFMTPSSISDFMASLFNTLGEDVSLLDPGAGVGSLTEAFVRRFLKESPRRSELNATTYEIEPLLNEYLEQNLCEIISEKENSGLTISHLPFRQDFILEGTRLASLKDKTFTHIILNPPYKKLAANSEYRKLLQGLGIQAPNLYVAFLALAVLLSKPRGEIVAIIPRSFCNGTYFRPFREWLFKHAALTHIHVFESRRKAFRDDSVLQENVIIKLVRSAKQQKITISESGDSTFSDYSERIVSAKDVLNPDDPEMYIRIPQRTTTDTTGLFLYTLRELGLEVATGPIVDFRLKNFLMKTPTNESAPLLYAHHFSKGNFSWPRDHKKPNAIKVTSETEKFLMPRGWYVVTKRFSTKEERRRVVASVVDPRKMPYPFYGFENHLNVIHARKEGLDLDIVHGLALFLNSTLIDSYFRTFSGHTQVNATDLRTMRFPAKKTLISYGQWAKSQSGLNQEKIDTYIQTHDDR